MADTSRPAAASSSFDEHDYTTWAGATLPVGYRWVDAGNGEEHLVAPDGRDLSAAEWSRVTGEPYGVVVTAPAVCGECGHRVDVHRAAFGDRLAGCQHKVDGRVCPCDLTAARIDAARRPVAQPQRERATELDVERHVPAPSLADALERDLELDAAYVAGVVTPAVIVRAAARGVGDIRGAALLATAARLV